MAIVGFGFTKMEAEKNKGATGKINISNNVSLKKVEKANMKVDENKKSMKVSFKFTSTYKPDVGSIVLEGEVMILDQKKKVEDELEQWEENNQLSDEMMGEVLNSVMDKCHVQALMLSKEMHLPPPITLPKFNVKDKEEEEDEGEDKDS